jgi:hypothetical protein
MSIKAVVTTLILGSSAVASAKPISQQAWEHEHGQRVVRDANAQRFERDRLTRERAERERLSTRDRFERDRPTRERQERQRIGERERIARIERERRYERERFEPRARYERDRWIRDHRSYRPVYSVDPGYYGRTWYRPGFVSLIAPTPIINGELFVSIAPELGAVKTIRLDGSGVSYVQQVVVEYDDGTSQVLAVNRYLDPSNPSLELAVPNVGCARRLVVYGQSEYGGQIAVTAAA